MKLLALALLTAAILPLAGCADPAGAPLDGGEPPDSAGGDSVPWRNADLRLSLSGIDLAIGEVAGARVEVEGGPMPPDLVWRSADETVLSVEPMGGGEARIRAMGVGRASLAVWSESVPDVHAAREIHVHEGSPFPPIPPQELAHGSFLLRASTRAAEPAAGDPAGAVRYRTEVRVENTSNEVASLRVGGCPVLVTLHMGGSWYDEAIHVHPPAYDQREDAQCGAAETMSLAPGASVTLDASFLAHEALQAARYPGRFWVHAHAAVQDTVLELAADSARLEPLPGNFSYDATTELLDDPPRLRTTVAIVNESADSTYIEFGACAVRVRAYSTPGRSGQPAWRSERRQPWNAGYGYACPAYLATRWLAPGERFSPSEFIMTAPLIEVLADSLPDGHYWFTARVEIDFQHGPEILAGDAELRLERPPLSNTRIYNYMTLVGSTAVTSQDPTTVRGRVEATLTHAGGALVDFSRDCPVRLVAYRDRARRDAGPRSGTPDWVEARTCSGAVDQRSLHRGQTVTFETVVEAGDILNTGLPEGRYYFSVVARVEGQDVYLSAGDVEVRR